MGKTPGATAVVFAEPKTLPSWSGDALVLGTPPTPGRYDRYSVNDLASAKMVFRIHGTAVFCPLTGASTLIVFSRPNIAYTPVSYQYEFIQVTNFDQGTEFDFNLPQEFLASGSLLLVQTKRGLEKKLSFTDLVLPLWNQSLGQNLPSQVTADGSPIFGWDPFPEGVQFLDPKHIYLTITQNVTVDFSDFWANYSCGFTYWFELTISSNILSGHVARWEAWVEGGAFTNVVMAILQPNVELGVFALNAALANPLPQIPVKDVYYLPGRQVDWPIGPGDWNVFEGDTIDDVTIVLELGT